MSKEKLDKFRCYACGDAENTDAHCDIEVFAGEPTQCPITGEGAEWNTRVEQPPVFGLRARTGIRKLKQ